MTELSLRLAARLRERRVLLVDDDALASAAVSRVLQPYGMHIVTARSLQQARKELGELRGERIDFAVIDDGLTDGTGRSLVTELRTLHPQVTLAVVSSHLNAERLLRGWQQDIAIVSKPTSPTQVRELMAALEERRYQLDVRADNSSEKPLVLVVEDSPAMNQAICTSLDAEFRTVSAFDGASAIRLALELRPDAILSDVIMPGIGGADLVRILRQRREIDAIPIVLMTGHGDERLRSKLLSEGAQDYVLKPIAEEELRGRLRNLVSHMRVRALLEPDASAQHRNLESLVAEVMRQKRHSGLLSESGKLLFGPLDSEPGLQPTLRMLVECVGGGAAILQCGPPDRANMLLVAHADADADESLKNFASQHPPRPDVVEHLLTTHRTSTAWRLSEAANDDSYSKLAREQAVALVARGFDSCYSVPLLARGTFFGVLTSLRRSGQSRSQGEEPLLEQLAMRVTHAIEHAWLYREATHAVRLRDDFLSIASHELKTPLNPLQLQVQSLQRKLPQVVAPDSLALVSQKTSTILRNIDRLTRLVNDLLDTTRIGAGQFGFEFTQVDLCVIVREVAEMFEERGELKQAGCTLQLDVDDSLVGRWDRIRLEQLVVNLLSNALKYGAGRPVYIECKRQGPNARLSVKDHGIGIAAEDLKRIFGRFERAVSVRHYGGLGLGLYITKQIVHGLGGHIEVESEPGVHTVFSVQLPLDGPSETPPR